MEPPKKFSIILLIMYVLGIVIRGATFDLGATDLNLWYEIGKYLGGTLMIVSLILSLINGFVLVKMKNIGGFNQWFWLFLNFIPLIVLLLGLIMI